MAMNLPGATLSTEQLPAPLFSQGITTPVFIGYLPGQKRDAPQMHKVTSLSAASGLTAGRGMMFNALRHFFDNGGFLCYVLSPGRPAADTSPAQQAVLLAERLTDPQVGEAISAELNVTLLVVPAFSQLNELNEEESNITGLWQQAWQALLGLASHRRDLFAMLEAPDEPRLAQRLLEDFPAASGQQAAAWWPRLQTRYRNEDGAYLTLSPLPAMAAVLQCNDRDRGIWLAPANLPLVSVIRPLYSISDATPLLNTRGATLNLIRSLVNRGVRPWGCRTLLNDADSPFRYIQTRLLVNRVEQQLSRLAGLYLFEPNTPLTWIKFKGQALNWLRQQWQAGAFCGAREEEAFSLQVGLGETMTTEEITAGKMNVSVRLALLAPAEFFTLRLVFDTQSGSAVNGGE